MAASAFYPVQYDILKDLDPISLLTISRLWLVSKMGFPARNTAELIAWLKANPNRGAGSFDPRGARHADADRNGSLPGRQVT